MKFYRKVTDKFLSGLLALSLALLFAGCSGGGGGSSSAGTGSGSTTPATTTVAGKVTLSSAVSSKPTLMKSMLNAPKGKPGSKAYKASLKATSPLKSATLAKVLSTIAFANGDVYLYNADHPEWLCPISTGKTDASGNYSLSTLSSAACNANNYKDGDPIPAGNYTLMAFKAGGYDPILGTVTKNLVAVQTIVSSFTGTVAMSDMEAQEGTSYPTVAAILGAKQNTDGTQTWGSSATELPANAAIQINFSAAMSRGSLTNGITISPAVSGKWALSADWTTATFYPDAGVTLTPNTLYTITVKGSDTDASNAVKNVYANALVKTAKGTFTAKAADTVAPTAIFTSPTTAEFGNPVDVTKPIRIGSNKPLDVNGLTLDGKVAGVSSLGAKPGVLYVGKDATSSLYVYEFVLGVPLKLGTTYDLTVSGGKGLNGIAMNTLTGSFATTTTTAGVDTTKDAATQNAQAAVKDIFGKWMRAFSDRNITQLQSLMSGEFYFEDTKTDPRSDLNHDGRLDLGEFSSMLSKQAFPQWEFCGATITGDVVGNINVVGSNADFQFQMNATTSNTSKDCGNTVPTDPFYVTAQNVNGGWIVVRTSVGIDTRTKTISYPNLIDGLTLAQSGTTIADGGQVPLLPSTTPTTFSWTAATGVSSYVLLRIDARNPEHGLACALPSSKTSFVTSTTGTACTDLGGVVVDSKFGFNSSSTSSTTIAAPFFVEGGQYYWEVIGLATATTSNIASKTPLDITKDITAISALNSFNIAGVYKEITALVYSGSAATGTPLTYSVIINGYDVGAANTATITVTTANTAATSGSLDVSGNFYKNYPLTFTGGVATVTVDLSTGQNWINVSDWQGLNKNFSIKTTGGIPKTVAITSIKDQAGTALVLDSWNYVKATGVSSVTISGTVNNTSITSVDVNVGNNTTGAYNHVLATVTGGAFTATVDIYKGDNWINVGAGFNDPLTNSWVWYGDYAGIYTDTGTVWVPNITINPPDGTLVKQTSSFGNSTDWDASAKTDNMVTITGTFKKPLNGNYSINSDGGWSNGTLTVLADGTFSLDVGLYKGWNYVSFNDADYNWFGVNIYTTAGKTVVKPTITTVNGVAPVVPLIGGTGSVSTTTCTATVVGTALAGSLNVYWNGYDGTTYNYEYQTLTLPAGATPETPVSFSFSVPLVSGTGSYNNIDIYDAGWKWTGVQVTTSTTCVYVAPTMTLGTVTDSAGTTLIPDMYGSYAAGASTSITLSGTSNRAGSSINTSLYACSSKNYSTTADASGNWTIPAILVYDGYNSASISSGSSWQSLSVNTTNGVLAPFALTASVSPATVTYTGSCGFNQWDAGTATSVTISGTTTAPAGTGTYTDASGSNKSFTIDATGNYSIANVALYDGYNSIFITDTAWNNLNVAISTTNGVPKPQYIAISAPVNTSGTTVSGIQTVTGSISDPTTSGYKPSVIRASVGVYDSTNFQYTYTYYSSDATDQTSFGNSPITYNSATGAFSFSANFGTAAYTYVDVYAYDNVIYANHGLTMYYNDMTGVSSGTTYYYKPGTKTKAVASNPAVTSSIMKQRLMNMNRNR